MGYTATFPQAQDMSAFPPASHDLLFLDDLLSPEEKRTRYAVREFMVNFCLYTYVCLSNLCLYVAVLA